MSDNTDSDIWPDIAKLYSDEPSSYAQPAPTDSEEADEFVMIPNLTSQSLSCDDDAETNRLLTRIPGSWLRAEAADKAARESMKTGTSNVSSTPIKNIADLNRFLSIVIEVGRDEYENLSEVLAAIVVGMMWIFCLWKFGGSAWE